MPAAARRRLAGRGRLGRARRRAAVHEADRPAGGLGHDGAAAALVDRAVVRRNREPALGRARRVGSAPACCSCSCRGATRWSLPLLVFVYFGVSQKPIEGKYRQASILDLFQGITAAHPDWVDRAVGRDAQVTLIWSGNTDKYSVWENEFFNRSVRHFYYTSAPLPGDLPEKPLTTDQETGLMRGPDGKVVRADYVLTDGDGRRRRPGRRPGRAQGDRPAADRRAAAPGLARGRALPAGHLVGTGASRTRGSAAAAARSRSRCRATPALFTKPTTVVASADGRRVARASVAPTATELLTRPAQSGTARRAWCASRSRRPPSPRSSPTARTPTRASSAVHFTRFTYKPSCEDRLRRLAALAPAHGDGQLHPRVAGGARRGSGRPSTRSSPSRRRARRGSGGSRRRSTASRSSLASGSCPFAHFWRQGWSRARPAAGRAVPRTRSTCSTSRTGCIRRSAAASARR